MVIAHMTLRYNASQVTPKKRNFKISLPIFSALLLGGVVLSHSVTARADDDWVAPSDAAQQSNPVTSCPTVLDAGKKIYTKRCAGCHGDSGNGDGPDAADLGIHPAKLCHLDPAKESDGALFWKIQTGKKPMPKYSAKLTPEEIWQVIHYIRGFRAN